MPREFQQIIKPNESLASVPDQCLQVLNLVLGSVLAMQYPTLSAGHFEKNFPASTHSLKMFFQDLKLLQSFPEKRHAFPSLLNIHSEPKFV